MGYNFSVPDWSERLAKGQSIAPDIPLNYIKANKALRILDRLKLPDVVGTPSLGKNSGQWIRDIVKLVFGSVDAAGVRHVRKLFAMVPKKNAKTTAGAAIMLIALILNERPRAEFVLVGPTQEVADGAFGQAQGMIEADDDPEYPLLRRFRIQEHRKTIIDRTNKAKLKIKTFDLKVATGSKPVGILVDEIHQMAGISYASKVLGQLSGGTIANPEGFMIMITTQSEEEPAGVFKQELDYARNVRDGLIEDPRVLPLIYEFPIEMQAAEDKPWRDPVNWHMVLPNLNRSIRIETLIGEFNEARDKGDVEERRWASQHLNVQIGIALKNWAGADYWESASDPSLRDLDVLLDRSEAVTVGGDGGGLDDLLALSVCGRDKITKDWLMWFHAWAHNDVLKRRPEIVSRLEDFKKEGSLTIVGKEDPTQDLREFVEFIARVRDSKKLPKRRGVGLDPYGVAALVDMLAAKDILTEDAAAMAGDPDLGTIWGVRQGAALSPATWGMERKLKNGSLWHDGSGLMRWVIGNLKPVQRGNAILMTKEVAGKAKIDPFVAGQNSFMGMALNPKARGESVYASRGIVTIEVG